MNVRNVLIVEDDSFKLERISTCIRRCDNDANCVIAKSVQDAVANIARQPFDIVLLDMALPSHDLAPGGGSPSSLLSGGLEIIMELAFLKRQDRVVIITQYPEIEIDGDLVTLEHVRDKLLSLCQVNLGSVLHFRDAESWEEELLMALER